MNVLVDIAKWSIIIISHFISSTCKLYKGRNFGLICNVFIGLRHTRQNCVAVSDCPVSNEVTISASPAVPKLDARELPSLIGTPYSF